MRNFRRRAARPAPSVEQPHGNPCRAGVPPVARRPRLMTRRTRFAPPLPLAARLTAFGITLGITLMDAAIAAPGDFPITDKQRSTAQQVASAGVPLSELAPNAPDSYTVKRGDTLWAISSVFLRSPWR